MWRPGLRWVRRSARFSAALRHSKVVPGQLLSRCGQYCAVVVDESRDEPPAEQLLRVAVRREAAAVVVVAAGEVDLLTVGRLRVAVEEALRAADGRPVVVDLTAVTFLGSHGLAALAEAASKAEQRREPLRVVVDETLAVIRPLQITGLDEVLALYYSVGDALPQ